MAIPNNILSENSDWLSYSSNLLIANPSSQFNPMGLQPYTMRFQFVNEWGDPVDYNPPVHYNNWRAGSIWKCISKSQGIWDYTRVDTSWKNEFSVVSWGPWSDINSTPRSLRVRVLGANLKGVTNMSSAFYYQTNMQYVGPMDTSDVTDFTSIFYQNDFLEHVELFDTSNATSTSGMFGDCYNLKSVPLFNTSNVTDMSGMFAGCYDLVTVPLFDTHNVTRMDNMFSGYTSITHWKNHKLESVPLFDTSNVTSMAFMFALCRRLKQIPLFNTSKVTNIRSMCRYCENVESGALALYNQASSQAVPPTQYDYCFLNCGINTITGTAELSQIPTSWGGTME